MLSFGNSPQNKQFTPPNQTAAQQELSEEEKQAAEQKRLFELSMKKAQDDLKTAGRDVFVRSH